MIPAQSAVPKHLANMLVFQTSVTESLPPDNLIVEGAVKYFYEHLEHQNYPNQTGTYGNLVLAATRVSPIKCAYNTSLMRKPFYNNTRPPQKQLHV